jgi:large subunit ribosomal protein L22
MQVAARLRYARISPQKCRLVADMVRGKPGGQALQVLSSRPRRRRGSSSKVLESAIANAEHNHGADIDELKVAAIMVDEAPTSSASMARAKGRGNRIIKRNSHITVQVADE